MCVKTEAGGYVESSEMLSAQDPNAIVIVFGTCVICDGVAVTTIRAVIRRRSKRWSRTLWIRGDLMAAGNPRCVMSGVMMMVIKMVLLDGVVEE